MLYYNNVKLGFVVEGIIEAAILRRAVKFLIPKALPSTETLLKIAKKYIPTRLASTKPHLLRATDTHGYLHNRDVLDMVYGVDLLLTYKGYTLAVDITVNNGDISYKYSKLERNQSALKALGVDACLVLLVEDAEVSTTLWTQQLESHLKVVVQECAQKGHKQFVFDAIITYPLQLDI